MSSIITTHTPMNTEKESIPNKTGIMKRANSDNSLPSCLYLHFSPSGNCLNQLPPPPKLVRQKAICYKDVLDSLN